MKRLAALLLLVLLGAVVQGTKRTATVSTISILVGEEAGEKAIGNPAETPKSENNAEVKDANSIRDLLNSSENSSQPSAGVNLSQLIHGALLGVGSFGKVCEGWYGDANRPPVCPFAVKTIPIKRIAALNIETQVKQELQYMRMMKGCRNLVQLHDVQVTLKDVVWSWRWAAPETSSNT